MVELLLEVLIVDGVEFMVEVVKTGVSSEVDVVRVVVEAFDESSSAPVVEIAI